MNKQKVLLISLCSLLAFPLAHAGSPNLEVKTTPTLRGEVTPKPTPVPEKQSGFETTKNYLLNHVTGYLNLTNNYVWRGITQSDNLPAIQGSLTYTFDNNIFLNVAGSNVKFGNATVELDAVLGYNGKIGEDFIYMVNLTRYNYPRASESNYNELNASATYRFLVVTAGYTPNVYNTHGTGIYTSLGFTYDIPETILRAKDVNISGGLGHYNLDKQAGPSYNDFNLQIQKKLSEVYLVALQWTGTFHPARDIAGNYPPTDKYVVGSLTASF